MANYKDYGFMGFLKKPYHIDQVKRLLAEILTA